MYVQCTLYMNIVHCTLYNVHAHEWYIVIRHVRCKHKRRTVPRIQTWTCEQTYKIISWYFYNVLAKDSSNMVIIGHETVYTLEIIIPRNHTFEPEAL